MNKFLTILKKLYHVCAFLCVLGVVLIFIFSVDIPVYDDESYTDGSGITWIKDKGVPHGYQVVESKSGTYNLKIYELDESKRSVVVAEKIFNIDLPLGSPLKSNNFSLYDGRQVILNVPITLK